MGVDDEEFFRLADDVFYNRITPGKFPRKEIQPVKTVSDFWQQLQNGTQTDWMLGTNTWSDTSKFNVKPKPEDPFMGNEPEDPRQRNYIIDLSDDEEEETPPHENSWPSSPCTCTGWGCQCGYYQNF